MFSQRVDPHGIPFCQCHTPSGMWLAAPQDILRRAACLTWENNQTPLSTRPGHGASQKTISLYEIKYNIVHFGVFDEMHCDAKEGVNVRRCPPVHSNVNLAGVSLTDNQFVYSKQYETYLKQLLHAVLRNCKNLSHVMRDGTSMGDLDTCK